MFSRTKTLIILCLTFIIGILIGFSLREFTPKIEKAFPKQCEYNGNTYKAGESFPAKDGCNNCGCENGEVICTLMACEK